VVKCTDGVYGSANAKCSPDQPDVDIMFMTSSALMDNCAAITGSTPHTLSTLAAQNKKKFKKQLEIFTAFESSYAIKGAQRTRIAFVEQLTDTTYKTHRSLTETDSKQITPDILTSAQYGYRCLNTKTVDIFKLGLTAMNKMKLSEPRANVKNFVVIATSNDGRTGNHQQAYPVLTSGLTVETYLIILESLSASTPVNTDWYKLLTKTGNPWKGAYAGGMESLDTNEKIVTKLAAAINQILT